MEKDIEIGKVIILKGSPGVGKSYTAKKLISKLGKKKIALIPIDEILHFDQRSLCEDKLKLAKSHAVTLIRSFLKEGFDVIVEYTFNIPEHLNLIIEKIKYDHLGDIPPAKIHVFHLTAKLDKVIKRNGDRKDGTDPLPRDTLTKLYKSCEETAGMISGEVLIDTNKLSAAKVATKILESINDNRFTSAQSL